MADNAGDDRSLAAGDFSSWVVAMQAAIRGERGSDVPCGDCTACCTSSQFVHIGPDEPETIARIPDELLFPAPRLPEGQVVLGQTGRTYDRRVFAAAGLELDDDDKVLIARQVRRWRFSFPTHSDRARHEGVRAAATFAAGSAGLGRNAAPTNATQLAVSRWRFTTPSWGATTVAVPDPEPKGPTRPKKKRPEPN